MIYKTIDLCAGIGGIRRGFELTGYFDNVLSAEIDECACKTYEHLFGENPNATLQSGESLSSQGLTYGIGGSLRINLKKQI